MKRTKITVLAIAFSFGIFNIGHAQILREIVKDAGQQVNKYKGKLEHMAAGGKAAVDYPEFMQVKWPEVDPLQLRVEQDG